MLPLYERNGGFTDTYPKALATELASVILILIFFSSSTTILLTLITDWVFIKENITELVIHCNSQVKGTHFMRLASPYITIIHICHQFLCLEMEEYFWTVFLTSDEKKLSLHVQKQTSLGTAPIGTEIYKVFFQYV